MKFFAGVPDSLLGDFCALVQDKLPSNQHVITANEGQAVAVAAGYHMATGKIPVVYMQNSGFGNTVNPLISLAHKQVYSIPMLLLIGWRGEPGRRDEPQHRVQGKIMPGLLSDCEIPFDVLPDYEEGAEDALKMAVNHFKTRKSPFALMVRKRTFETYKSTAKIESEGDMTREECITAIAESADPWTCFVGTTGFASRELYEYRVKAGQKVEREF
eukprot:UN31198